MKTKFTIFTMICVIMVAMISTATAGTADVAPNSSGNIDITNLTFYDRDNNGILSKQEIEVVITDCYEMRLTDPQINCLIEILGYYPLIGTMPAVKTPPPVIEEIDERIVVIINKNHEWYLEGSIIADDVIINGNRNTFLYNYRDPVGVDTDTMTINGNHNWIVTNTNTLDINGNRNFVGIVNRYVESITIIGNRNHIAIPRGSTSTIDDTGYRNRVWHYNPWWTP